MLRRSYINTCDLRMKKSHKYVFCIQVFGYPKSSNLSGFAQKVGRHKIQWFIVPILYSAITWRKKTYVNKHQPVTHNSLQEFGFHHPQPLQSQLDAFHLRSHGCVVAAHLVLQAPEAPAPDFETAEGQLQGWGAWFPTNTSGCAQNPASLGNTIHTTR